MLIYLFCKCLKKLQMACPRVENVIVPERIFTHMEYTKPNSSDSKEEELIHDRFGIEYSEYYDDH
jgi:hypothetical protein